MPFFESDYTPKIKPNYDKCTPVSVIISFSRDGKMMPVCFGMADLYGNQIKVNIDGVKYTKDKIGCISYYCLYSVGKQKRECMLTYYVSDHLWVLEK